MVKSYKNLVLGFWIAILPFLGLPLSFKFSLVVLSGLLLVFMSVSIDLPKKSQVQKKPKKIKQTIALIKEDEGKEIKTQSDFDVSEVNQETSDGSINNV